MVKSYARVIFRLMPFYLISAGLILGPMIWARLDNAKIEAANSQYVNDAHTQSQVKATLSGHPVRVVIPRLQLDLPVKDGGYNADTKTWVLGQGTAFFDTDMANPNNSSGMTLIYGHDTVDVFAPTSALVKGDKVLVKTSNHLQFEYYFISKHDVIPGDVSILNARPTQPELTLLTCSGPTYQTRALMTFKFLRVTRL